MTKTEEELTALEARRVLLRAIASLEQLPTESIFLQAALTSLHNALAPLIVWERTLKPPRKASE